MQIKIECSSCSKQFAVGGNGEVKQRNIISVKDDKVLKVTYFFCPECGYEHIVQLDDEYTDDLLKKTQTLLKAKVMLGRVGKNVTAKEKREFKNIRTLITEYRNGLMTKYDSTMFKEEDTGIEFELKCVTGIVEDGEQDEEKQ